jgi:hypothetical protein
MKGMLNIKIYSATPNSTEKQVVSVLEDMIKLKDITGFLTCMCDDFWWLGCVLSMT